MTRAMMKMKRQAVIERIDLLNRMGRTAECAEEVVNLRISIGERIDCRTTEISKLRQEA